MATTDVRTAQPSSASDDSRKRNEALLGGIVHDLQNHLFGVSATLDALEVRVTQVEDSSQPMRILRAELASLESLIKDLNDLRRPGELELRELPAEELVERALERAKPSALKNGVFLEKQMAAELPRVRVDAEKIVEILCDLLEFSLQRASSQGRVVFKAIASKHGADSYVSFSVFDNCGSLPREKLTAFFEPFVTKRRGKTGLAFYLGRQMVEAHGGSISVEGRQEGGTSYTLRLPAAT